MCTGTPPSHYRNDLLKRTTSIVAFLILSITLLVFAREPAPPAYPPVDDPDAYLRKQMETQWSTLERRTWRIEYKPIAGLQDRRSWHVKDTIWWVQIYPEFIFDELDKKSVYDIEAVALNQNYGTIDF